jgi:hypothetical protein
LNRISIANIVFQRKYFRGKNEDCWENQIRLV